MEYQVAVATAKSVDEAVQAVEEALMARKFSVLWHLDMNSKLAEKGLQLERKVHVLEVCSAPRAKQAIETNPEVAYFLPCKIVISESEGHTQIGLARPTMLMNVLGDERLKDLAVEVEGVLTEAIQAAQ